MSLQPRGGEAWEEYFDGNTLDESRWTIEAWDRADLQFGAPGYIPDSHIGYYLSQHVDLDSGYLRLKLDQEKLPPDEAGNVWVVSSGALIFTKETYGYGTYEWVMRMSSTSDTPLGPGSPLPGSVSAGFIYVNNSETEIDFEFSGHFLQDADPANDETLYMVNWHNADPSRDPKGSETTVHTETVIGLNQRFYTYKFVWEEGRITFYVDGDEQITHTTNVPSAPAHFMINHWGTNNPVGFGGQATLETPRYSFVDRVRYTPLDGTEALPEAPSNLTGTAESIITGRGRNKIVEAVFVDLTWQDNSSNEDSFVIERCKPVGRGKNKTCNFLQFQSAVGANVTSYRDDSVESGTQYRYRVKARNSNGDSPYSNIAEVKVR